MGCKQEQPVKILYTWHPKTVSASAYNSLVAQTSSNPNITAFGDSIHPGQKYIAVSRDLLKKELPYNTLVKIEGLEGIYIVKDKMNKRYKNHIDVYMGLDVEAAKQWGRRVVNIEYGVEIKDHK
ncbi:3D domain-containing protein [Tamlana agarivorans]|uniref:3D domain-containing protein n=1 Tax=Pseudotamlana agarivorans TaxID=481183 RepID=A0ACC5U9Z1_9FLAO|nr:3D domain-containing protein [Tamlana agarivorans]MBU2951064.1 3D domain-containing protein [Tamlana agarivorans]